VHGPNGIPGDVLDLFLEQCPSAAFLRDDAGVYLWVNQAYAEIYDLPDPAAMVGRDLFEFDPPLLAATYLDSDQEVLRSRDALRHALPLARRDGVGEAIGQRFRVALPDGGYGVGGIYTDVTELHRARAEVRRFESRYTSVFERSGVALALVGAGGALREVNPAFAELLARPAADLVGTPLRHVLGVEEAATVLTGGSGPIRLTVGVRLPGGRLRPATATATADVDTPEVVLALQPLRTSLSDDLFDTLSTEEAVLLELLALGEDNSTIADRMNLSRQGLDYHIRRLRHRMRASTRVDVVSRAYAAGLLDPASWPPRICRVARR
jgi:PAS domain-containing protein